MTHMYDVFWKNVMYSLFLKLYNVLLLYFVQLILLLLSTPKTWVKFLVGEFHILRFRVHVIFFLIQVHCKSTGKLPEITRIFMWSFWSKGMYRHNALDSWWKSLYVHVGQLRKNRFYAAVQISIYKFREYFGLFSILYSELRLIKCKSLTSL